MDDHGGTRFLEANLGLLGFGNRCDGLVQAVKELFENALDAVLHRLESMEENDAAQVLLRVRVQEDTTTGLIDIVCTDSGAGIPAHQLKELCTQVFTTTKTSGGDKNGVLHASGKYGVGLKAATLYSQQHVRNGCLKITTTSSLNPQVLYVELRIDSNAAKGATIEHVAQFELEEEHEFAGTEMRISVPIPECEGDVEHAADMLALYFQSLAYTTPAEVGVEFSFFAAGVLAEVSCRVGIDAIDRFAEDMSVDVDEITFSEVTNAAWVTSCMAVVSDHPEVDGEVEISVLRYANHSPLLNGDDMHRCAIIKATSSAHLWKKFGFRCELTGCPVNQLKLIPLRAVHLPGKRVVMAVNISARGSNQSPLTFCTLKKSALDAIYAPAVTKCVRAVFSDLFASGILNTPQAGRDHTIVTEYLPLIAASVTAIADRADMFAWTDDQGPAEMVEEIAHRLETSLQLTPSHHNRRINTSQ